MAGWIAQCLHARACVVEVGGGEGEGRSVQAKLNKGWRQRVCILSQEQSGSRHNLPPLSFDVDCKINAPVAGAWWLDVDRNKDVIILV